MGPEIETKSKIDVFTLPWQQLSPSVCKYGLETKFERMKTKWKMFGPNHSDIHSCSGMIMAPRVEISQAATRIAVPCASRSG